MYFVSTWAAFGCSLFWLNRMHGRRVFYAIPAWEEGVLWRKTLPFSPEGDSLSVSVNWKACVLFACGFVGGIFSAIAGRWGRRTSEGLTTNYFALPTSSAVAVAMLSLFSTRR